MVVAQKIEAVANRNATLWAAQGSWALLFGIGLLMVGNGLQSSLLGVRASQESFGNGLTGLIMSGYFIGFLAGSTWTPRAVRRVGHIRSFAALASLASIAILLHAVFVTPSVWGFMRFVTGLSYAGLYVVAESWLNERTSNETRGRLLSVYMVISYFGMGSGHLSLSLADPGGFDLFVLVSVIISFAVIPILLSAVRAPEHAAPRPVSVLTLYRVSPLGTVGTLLTGMANGAVFGMGAVYARESGLTVTEISVFMALLIAGGALFQWPIGRLSDYLDRRTVIMTVAFAAGGTGLIANRVAGLTDVWLLGSAFVFGGMTLTLYSLCVAYTNDYLDTDQLVAASSGLVLLNGVGAILGPSIAGWAMDFFGPPGFFWWLGIVHGVIGVFALWRMTRRATPPTEEQGPYVPVPARSSPFATAAAEEVYAEHEHGHETADPEKAEPVGGGERD